MHLVASVSVCECVSVCLSFSCLDLETSFLVCRYISEYLGQVYMSSHQVKVTETKTGYTSVTAPLLQLLLSLILQLLLLSSSMRSISRCGVLPGLESTGDQIRHVGVKCDVINQRCRNRMWNDTIMKWSSLISPKLQFNS